MGKADLLLIPRREKMPEGAILVGIKHGTGLMAIYEGEGRLTSVFDSLREVDLYVPDAPDDQPVTIADLTRARIESFDEFDADGLTYFIGGDIGAIKIGRSINLALRLKDIQACSPIPIRVLATRPGGKRERLYHALFAAHRLHGEWFARCPEIEAEIARLATPALPS